MGGTGRYKRVGAHPGRTEVDEGHQLQFTELVTDAVFGIILAAAAHDGPALNHHWEQLGEPAVTKQGTVLLLALPRLLVGALYPSPRLTEKQAGALASEIWTDLEGWYPFPPEADALGEVLAGLAGSTAPPRALPTEMLKWRPLVSAALLRHSPFAPVDYREPLALLAQRFERLYPQTQAEINRRTGKIGSLM